MLPLPCPTCQGMIEEYDQPFDVALALHACGNATDATLQLAVAAGAAFVVSPCCVGGSGRATTRCPHAWPTQHPLGTPTCFVKTGSNMLHCWAARGLSRCGPLPPSPTSLAGWWLQGS